MKYNLLDEIKTTYADNQDGGKDFEETKHIRRLDWKAEESVSGENLLEALKAIGEGYNDFDPINATDTILTVDPEAEVYVAREGSVCLYIKTDKPHHMIAALNADEGDIQHDGLVRIWWD
jgi:hypothetical protein